MVKKITAKYITWNLAWYVLCTATIVEGKVGCMAIDKPVSKYDNKTYHYVECNCPCRAMLAANRNQCFECGHYHDVEPLRIMSEQEVARGVAAAKEKKTHRRRPPRAVIKQLIAKYRAKKGW